jgi:hypothetical protein
MPQKTSIIVNNTAKTYDVNVRAESRTQTHALYVILRGKKHTNYSGKSVLSSLFIGRGL